ncbi:hypothetical protein ABIA39_002955 [Nocardia sp. GAS34]|uniref:DUF4333 domain-containing protein n=1 Tax=unclassified Nocardia TaxID=2637762 RepID=UPI003D23166D
MSGPYGPNDTPGAGSGSPSDPTQWGGQQQWGQPGQASWPQQGAGSADPTQQWSGQSQQQWGQESSPSWPQQQPAQPSAWDPTQQQWGQPGQQGQQWTQSDWSQQPGSPAQPSSPVDGEGKKKSRKGLLFGGIGALVVVVVAVVLGFVFLGSDQLDNSAVQTGVQKVLKDSYGIDDVQDVSCPSGEEVKVNNSFDCSLKVGGEKKKVTIKVTKSDGTYEVGRPS